jgi:hypothetical protein
MAAKLTRLTQNNDITAPSGRELYHLQFSLQAASPDTFGYTLVYSFVLYNFVFVCWRLQWRNVKEDRVQRNGSYFDYPPLCDVADMILLQTYLYACRILGGGGGSPLKSFPWAAIHLVQRCCHCRKHFWKACCRITFCTFVTFLWLSFLMSWSLHSFKANFIFGNNQKSFRANQGNGMGVLF